MARPLRLQFSQAWYHVMNRGRRGEPVFLGKEDYQAFVELLEELVKVYRVRMVAYCLMSNHYHLLLQTLDGNLSRAMRHLNGIYTQRFNRRHSMDGPLFRGRYKSILVDANTYLLALVRYIHRNPLEAGLVGSLGRHLWSSHRGYLSNARKWDWLSKDMVLSQFSVNRATAVRRYRQYVSEKTSEEISDTFGKGALPSVLGSESFVEKIKERFFSGKLVEEIPESRRLAPDVDKIKKEVCRVYEVSEGSLSHSRRGHFNEPRDVAIYLIRNLRGNSLKEIGLEFGIENYSTVSSAIQRVQGLMRKESDFKNRVEDLSDLISKGQRQT